ncbi:MAG TPA: hypothetical protein VIM62_05660 [Acidobacteriaceae bacterium]
MNVQLAPDVQARLDQLSLETGRSQEEFVNDAMACYFDELERTRQMIDSRYDEIKSGRVQAVDGEEVFARLRAKN